MMEVGILGIGVVTPLGSKLTAVWAACGRGVLAEPCALPGLPGHRPLPVFRVDPACEVRHPRLRRASPISHFAAAAAQAAVAESGPLPAGRTALVFAATDGAVIYTRRFYEEVVAAGSGSPLLFPETVYNAAASHVAAVFGMDGCVLTMVGDAVAGLAALSTAADLIRSGEADRCLVVASQEVDWIACEGYRRWGIARGPRQGGAVLAESACALVLGPASPGCAVLQSVRSAVATASGEPVRFQDILQSVAGARPPDLAVLSAIRSDGAEQRAAEEEFPSARLAWPKVSLGEAFSTSTLLQVACAAQEVRGGGARSAVVSVAGLQGAAGGAFLTASAGGE